MTQNSINAILRQVQRITSSTSAVVTCSTTIPNDNTIPQKTEGDEVLTVTITPSSTTSTLYIWFTGVLTKDGTAGRVITALFQDTTSNALCASNVFANGGKSVTGDLRYVMTSGTTSSTTFKIRVGGDAGSVYTNADSTGTRTMGGISNTTLTVTEYL